jgi:hypothetical protein
MSPLERVLEQLDALGAKPRPTKSGWQARCPAHEDRQPSLSLSEGEDGRVLVHCFAGCPPERILSALSLTFGDLGPSGEGGEWMHTQEAAHVHARPGLTLAAYAEAKALPLEFMRELGLSEISYQSHPAVRIPYRDERGEEVAVRYRCALTGEGRFRWKKGTSPTLYGLWRLPDAQRAGFICLVEGESDCQTLWLHGVPALGLPGAALWDESYVDLLAEIDTIYVVVEPDAGGEATLAWLCRSSIRGRVRLVRLEHAKDPSELFLDDRERFPERFQAALEQALPWAAHEQAEAERAWRSAWLQCQELAQEERILDRVAEALVQAGHVGDEREGRLLYLALTSRLFERPVSVAVKGPSAAGKSHLVDCVLRFFPPSAVYELSAMSERALAYSQEPLSHRFLVLYEAAGLGGDFGSYLLRSLLSEGRVRYETVEKTAAGLKPRLITREGPTGLIVTTTQVSLHPENETRLLSLTVTDTCEQTHDILLQLASGGSGECPDYERWQALQEWLASGEHRVEIPYARALAEQIPPIAVRLRRDFAQLLTLVKAHALLHQAHRERDAEGRILASLEDYATVRGLVADLVAEGIGATVSECLRETVAAVASYETDGGMTVRQLADRLGLDRSAAYRRARTAIAGGYLRNLEERRGRPARLALDEPLPDEVELLPMPERVQACMSGGQNTSAPLPVGLDEHRSPPAPAEPIDDTANDWPVAA